MTAGQHISASQVGKQIGVLRLAYAILVGCRLPHGNRSGHIAALRMQHGQAIVSVGVSGIAAHGQRVRGLRRSQVALIEMPATRSVSHISGSDADRRRMDGIAGASAQAQAGTGGSHAG